MFMFMAGGDELVHCL